MKRFALSTIGIALLALAARTIGDAHDFDLATLSKPHLDRLAQETGEACKVSVRDGDGILVVAGAQTDECIRSTLHGAIVRGYDVTLVADAHTTEDLSPYGAPPPDKVIAHTNLYWQYHRAPGRTAGTVTTSDVDFAPRATTRPGADG
jgi:hypothetical protein